MDGQTTEEGVTGGLQGHFTEEIRQGRGRQSRKEKAQAAGLQGVKESSEEGTLGSNEGCFGLGNPVGT